MNSEWVDNIDVNEMIYLASFDDDLGDRHTLAFYYKDYLLVIQENASVIVVWKNTGSRSSGIYDFECVYSFNYFNKEDKSEFLNFKEKYEKMVKNITFIFKDKEEIVERFKIQKRKSTIEEFCK